MCTKITKKTWHIIQRTNAAVRADLPSDISMDFPIEKDSLGRESVILALCRRKVNVNGGRSSSWVFEICDGGYVP